MGQVMRHASLCRGSQIHFLQSWRGQQAAVKPESDPSQSVAVQNSGEHPDSGAEREAENAAVKDGRKCRRKGKERSKDRERGTETFTECQHRCEQQQDQKVQRQVKTLPNFESACAISTQPYTAQEESLLHLASAIDTISLRAVISDALSTVLPKVESIYIYLLDVKSSKLLCDNPPHEMSKEGRLREAVVTKQRIKCNGLHKTDIQVPRMNHLLAPLPTDKQIMILPVIDTDIGRVISVILVYCGLMNDINEPCFRILERHICASCKRVQALLNPLSWSHFSIGQVTNAEMEISGAFDELDRKVLQLCGELYDLDATALQLKIIQYLQRETHSMCCCLLVVAEGDTHLFCQVVGDKVLEEEIIFPLDFAHLEQSEGSNKALTLSDISPEQHMKLNSILGFEVRTMLCVPVICRATDNVVALGCAFNKRAGNYYTEVDEQTIRHCFQYTATVLTSTMSVQKEQKLKIECQALLQVAKNLFTHLDNVTVLLQEIIQEARNLTNAESCSVFLLEQNNKELVAKVFDGGFVTDESAEFRMPADQGIAGHVATTGQILNIKDAYSHPLFYRGVDDTTGFRTRNILCFPIIDENNQIVGVAELCNKINGPWFTKFDEDLALAFSIYCGISIAHSLLYKKVHEAQYRSHLANEMMMYHMKLCLDRFCLMVQKGYRDPPYHNWTHAFSVTHFCYLLYKNLPLAEYLLDLEILALFVSCMCHDLDHRGTNNSFQVASKSVLAALYSSEGSVMERHHFAQAIAILNSEGCNIFESFSRKDYQKMLDLMRDIILATDMAHHIEILPALQEVVKAYDKKNEDHHTLLLNLMMTTCDLNDQTKGWKTTIKTAELIYKEFFSQGDLEKAMGNRPLEMMDREKAYVPDLQINFMEHICMPTYKLLMDIFPLAEPLYQQVKANRDQWVKVSSKFSFTGLPSSSNLDFLTEIGESQLNSEDTPSQ
ncbi:cGMP-dependent 3',5'-cyclic phosphodiesterase [Hypanus sabinus]|uniref:cGMP-dependent 3',5'-cyclic phosphodiesterase n=1 Tax=Hypanus sabinus TaxID=79690 RepID=UPI0028C45087|nr:cGMP-dependent 3',5'-cyclic phosphodiesterase [Hypanus sabinus]